MEFFFELVIDVSPFLSYPLRPSPFPEGGSWCPRPHRRQRKGFWLSKLKLLESQSTDGMTSQSNAFHLLPAPTPHQDQKDYCVLGKVWREGQGWVDIMVPESFPHQAETVNGKAPRSSFHLLTDNAFSHLPFFPWTGPCPKHVLPTACPPSSSSEVAGFTGVVSPRTEVWDF